MKWDMLHVRGIPEAEIRAAICIFHLLFDIASNFIS